jgi:DNA-binding PucR family transcriptional regulator
LGIHLNTARYRAGRIEELLHKDFESADDRLEIQLALKVLETRELLAPSST